ncbi:MAG: four helix bundle protein [Bacteroidales bacterium]|nr:four helix bundle protein [Bacteroidales bacterium]
MKIEEILRIESTNTDSIILFKEGIFLRAYERSAMRFTEYIAEFKVFKRHFKVVNADVCYLGFPYSNHKILFESSQIKNYSETGYYLVIFGCPSKGDFEIWKANIQLPTAEDHKPQVLLRPDVQPKELKNLHIFKRGYDIMVELHRYAETMPRTHRYTIGERIKNESIALAVATYRIGHDRCVRENRVSAVEHIEIIRLMLRLLTDLKQVSVRYFAKINQDLEYLYVELLK